MAHIPYIEAFYAISVLLSIKKWLQWIAKSYQVFLTYKHNISTKVKLPQAF